MPRFVRLGSRTTGIQYWSAHALMPLDALNSCSVWRRDLCIVLLTTINQTSQIWNAILLTGFTQSFAGVSRAIRSGSNRPSMAIFSIATLWKMICVRARGTFNLSSCAHTPDTPLNTSVTGNLNEIGTFDYCFFGFH